MLALMQIGTGMLSTTYLWLPVAVAGATAILAIIALIYALSPLFGRNDLRAWARTEIFEVLLSLLFIFIFFAIFAIINGINFGSVYGPLSPSTCTGNTNLTTLAMCDTSYFGGYVSILNQVMYQLSFVASLTGTWAVTTQPTTLASIIPETGSTSSGAGNPNAQPTTKPYANLIIKFIYSLAPGGFVGAYFMYMSILFMFYILLRVLLILLATAPVLVSIFMGVGLIARIFPVTRSFGGALIAFGVGIGIILPLLLAMSYGFMDVAIENTNPAVNLNTFVQAVTGLVNLITIVLTGNFITYSPALLALAFILIGVLFVPVIDLVLVDVFVRDFSQSVGERMDFLSLLTNLGGII
ncbi:MAG: hypothetical protein ACP5T4_02655 [Candidatus Micrarchaeia archaeon]